MSEYSANDRLEKFSKETEFTCHIFDKSSDKGVKLRVKNTDQEIDAILLYKNIVCLIGINKTGRTNTIKTESKRFFSGLIPISNTDIFLKNIYLDYSNAKKKIKKKKVAEFTKDLKKIKKHINNQQKSKLVLIKKIFFCPGGIIEEEYFLPEYNKEHYILDKEIVRYIKLIGERLSDDGFSHREFLDFLNVRKIDTENRSSSAIRAPEKTSPHVVTKLITQKGNVTTYTLSVKVEEILEYVTVLRMSQKYNVNGFQRMVDKKRLDKINKEYLNKNETFPNNIIIALKPDVYSDDTDFIKKIKDTEHVYKNIYKIEFYKDYNSLIIIDGQHRFFSLVSGGKKDREVLLTLIHFGNKERKKNYDLMHEMFYKINNTQLGIDPNLNFALTARLNKKSNEYFWQQVFKKILSEKIFSGRFSFNETTLKTNTSEKSIVSVLKYGGVLKLNEILKKIDGLNSLYTGDQKENISFSIILFKEYFKIIDSVLRKQGCSRNDVTPREIGALMRLIRHFLTKDKTKNILKNVVKGSKEEKKIAKKYIRQIIETIDFKQVFSMELSASNWAAIEGYMLSHIHNLKINKSFGSKKLLSKKGEHMYEGAKKQ